KSQRVGQEPSRLDQGLVSPQTRLVDGAFALFRQASLPTPTYQLFHFPHTRAHRTDLAAILDAWSRRVGSYAINRSIDARLAIAALKAAIRTWRRPCGCIHQSDRGSRYGSEAYRTVLRPGIPRLDGAAREPL